MVHFDSVGKDYGDVTALQKVTFSIPKGGIVGLLGPNGAGKTTTMRIMTGFMEPTRGEVKIADRPFSPDSVELKRRIGYLPESAPVYGDMLAWDYLTYEARLHGVDTGTRVVDVIQEVGLGSHAHKPIRELSKGYRQRVGLAHTLLHDPELLVLDEPTNGLDPNQIVEVRGLIRRIAETKTVILSTHIMQEVEALCERVIVIHNGAIRYDGSIQAFSPSVQAVRVSVDGIDFSDLERRLRAIPGFRSVERAGGATGVDGDERLLSVTVYADPGDDPRPHIFRLAAGEGDFTIYEMARERTSVEALFRELTRDEATDAEDGGES